MRQSLFVTTAVLLLAGCSISVVAGGEPVTHSSDLPNFDQLDVSRGVLVTLSCGPAAKAVVRGDLREVMDTEIHVEGRVLIVRRARMIGDDRPRVHVDVTISQPLDHIVASSGSSVDAPSCALSAERLDLEASSGATLDLAVNTRHLTAEASSGGTISRLDGARIDAGEADLHASSGGTVRVCSVGRLNGHASSGGAITSEPPETGDRSASSGGDFSTRRCS